MGMRSLLITFSILLGAVAADASSVWRVTENNGNVIYLGGSVHGLSSTDYPLPSAYNRAFDASSRLVFEDEPNVSASAMRNLYKSGFYPKNDSLK
ncbi:MAG: TraB/GumN family protein, partial [Verrucomicrobia bacterium]